MGIYRFMEGNRVLTLLTNTKEMNTITDNLNGYGKALCGLKEARHERVCGV